MPKTKVFHSYDEYENWTEKFENASDYEEIPVAIDDDWKFSADLFTECKSYKTAIRRFISAFSEIFPDLKYWGEEMKESCGNGYWNSNSNGYQTPEENRRIAKEFGAFSWGVEETMDGYWYIFLNISGEYAGKKKSE